MDAELVRMAEVAEACSRCRCGCCKDQCPMYTELLEESISPKGRNALIRAVLKGDVEPDERAVRIAYSCLLCRRDEQSCVAGLRNSDATEAFRRFLVEKGAKLLPEHAALAKSLDNYGNPWQESRTARKRWAKGLQNKKVVPGKTSTLFYVGCTFALDRTLDDGPKAMASLMDKAGVDYGMLLEDEVCCGSTARRLGDIELFEKLRMENVKRIRGTGVENVVTACAGCFKTLEQDYPVLSEDISIMHSTQFISELIANDKLHFSKRDVKVTYHDPCHLGRHSEVYDAPRRVLLSVPGLELIEMKNSRKTSRCCGGGAGVKTAYPEVSKKVAIKRLREAEETGAEVLITTCPFCVQTLRGAASATGSTLRVEELSVFLDKLSHGSGGAH
jgi:heterodisulfide reductase subunit D